MVFRGKPVKREGSSRSLESNSLGPRKKGFCMRVMENHAPFPLATATLTWISQMTQSFSQGIAFWHASQVKWLLENDVPARYPRHMPSYGDINTSLLFINKKGIFAECILSSEIWYWEWWAVLLTQSNQQWREGWRNAPGTRILWIS